VDAGAKRNGIPHITQCHSSEFPATPRCADDVVAASSLRDSARGELFQPDGLHLNAEGYKLWSDVLRPHLQGD